MKYAIFAVVIIAVGYNFLTGDITIPTIDDIKAMIPYGTSL